MVKINSNTDKFIPMETDKNFIMVDDINKKYIMELRKRFRDETGVFFTQNKILHMMIECINEKELDGRIEVLSKQLKGGK